MAKLPQSTNGQASGLSAYNQRALAKNPSLAAAYGITGSSSGSSSSSSSNPAADNFNSILSASESQVGAAYGDYTDAYKTLETSTSKTYTDAADAVMAQEPAIRQSYADLSKELDISETADKTQAQQTGEQNVGNARASLAAAGVQNAQGAFRAPVTAAEETRDQQFTQISDKYNVSKDELTQQMNSDINGLITKANDYAIAGNQQMVGLTTDMIKLKAQQQTEALSMAQSYLSAETQSEKDDLENKKLDMQMQHNDQMMQLAVDKLNQAGSSGTNLSLKDQIDLNAAQEKRITGTTVNQDALEIGADDANGNSIKVNTYQIDATSAGGDDKKLSALQYTAYITGNPNPSQADLHNTLITYGSSYEQNVVAPLLKKAQTPQDLAQILQENPWLTNTPSQ